MQITTILKPTNAEKTNQHEEELIKYNKRIDTAEHYAKKPFVQNDEKIMK